MRVFAAGHRRRRDSIEAEEKAKAEAKAAAEELLKSQGAVILSRFVGLFLLNLPCADKDDTV